MSRRPNGAGLGQVRSTHTAGPLPWSAAKSGQPPVNRRTPYASRRGTPVPGRADAAQHRVRAQFSSARIRPAPSLSGTRTSPRWAGMSCSSCESLIHVSSSAFDHEAEAMCRIEGYSPTQASALDTSQVDARSDARKPHPQGSEAAARERNGRRSAAVRTSTIRAGTRRVLWACAAVACGRHKRSDLEHDLRVGTQRHVLGSPAWPAAAADVYGHPPAGGGAERRQPPGRERLAPGVETGRRWSSFRTARRSHQHDAGRVAASPEAP